MKKNGFGHGMTIISGRSFSEMISSATDRRSNRKDFMGVPTFVGFLL